MTRMQKQTARIDPKGRVLADFVTRHPRQAVFLRTRELAPPPAG